MLRSLRPSIICSLSVTCTLILEALLHFLFLFGILKFHDDLHLCESAPVFILHTQGPLNFKFCVLYFSDNFFCSLFEFYFSLAFIIGMSNLLIDPLSHLCVFCFMWDFHHFHISDDFYLD